MSEKTKSVQISALIKPELDPGGITKMVTNIQAALKKFSLPPTLEKEFEDLFGAFNTNIDKINDSFSKGFETKGAVNSLNQLTSEMTSSARKIAEAWDEVSSKTELINLPPDQAKRLQEINTQLQQMKAKLNQLNPKNLEQVTQSVEKLKGKAGKKAGTEALEFINQGDAQQAINTLDIIIDKREKMSTAMFKDKAKETFTNDTAALIEMRDALVNAETETKGLSTQINSLNSEKTKITSDAMKQLAEETGTAKANVEKLAPALEETESAIKGAAKSSQEFTSELDQIKSRIQYFFSLNNAILLVRRALQQTFEASKELDAVMTETAVVTDFSVSDMWDMLPEYTKTAQELGATTKGVYETLTLFYQQGLDTNEAMALGVETLKMARIAGMDYEEATSKITAALRGFNMELDELSAKRVNDVYSELAA